MPPAASPEEGDWTSLLSMVRFAGPKDSAQHIRLSLTQNGITPRLVVLVMNRKTFRYVPVYYFGTENNLLGVLLFV